jgi:hypothetical protein
MQLAQSFVHFHLGTLMPLLALTLSLRMRIALSHRTFTLSPFHLCYEWLAHNL